jgi:hypothetical protein
MDEPFRLSRVASRPHGILHGTPGTTDRSLQRVLPRYHAGPEGGRGANRECSFSGEGPHRGRPGNASDAREPTGTVEAHVVGDGAPAPGARTRGDQGRVPRRDRSERPGVRARPAGRPRARPRHRPHAGPGHRRRPGQDDPVRTALHVSGARAGRPRRRRRRRSQLAPRGHGRRSPGRRTAPGSDHLRTGNGAARQAHRADRRASLEPAGRRSVARAAQVREQCELLDGRREESWRRRRPRRVRLPPGRSEDRHGDLRQQSLATGRCWRRGARSATSPTPGPSPSPRGPPS